MLDAEQGALGFDQAAWGIVRLEAEARGVDTGALIAAAVVQRLGPTARP